MSERYSNEDYKRDGAEMSDPGGRLSDADIKRNPAIVKKMSSRSVSEYAHRARKEARSGTSRTYKR